jgi:ATP-dependent Clp protease, protease subunit
MNFKYRNDKNARFIASQYNKSLDKPDWYNFKALSDEETEVIIYDYIGWPFNDAGEFVRAMADIRTGKITIRINSPGGDVFDGIAIFNSIKAHPLKPITRVESLAASAAHYISLAGSEKQAYKNSMIMMHRPMTFTVGNEDDHQESLDVLHQIGGIMVDSYADATGLGKKEIAELLKGDGKKDGTWMTAKQAKEKGFIDTIIEAGKPVKAQFDLSVFSQVPEQLFVKADPDIRDIEKVLRDAGLSKNKAKAVLARGWSADAPTEEASPAPVVWDAAIADSLIENINRMKGIR